MRTIVYDIEVVFFREITEIAIQRGIDEKNLCSGRFGPIIDASTKYIANISYKINNGAVVDLVATPETEHELLAAFVEAYNSCDESVAHYGKKFDIRFINSRLEYHHLPRLRPIKLHDTWQILKSNFLLPNNRLDTAIQFFGCPYGKPSLPWDVWRQVSLGSKKAHKTLTHRCRYDVKSLGWLWQNVFVKYAKRANPCLPKPYVNDIRVSEQLKKAKCLECLRRGTLTRQGYNRAKTQIKMALKCTACGKWCSSAVKKDGSLGGIQ